MSADDNYLRNFPTCVEALSLPAEPEKRWDLASLDDPPDDFTFLERRYDRIHDDRTFRLATVKILGSMHFWGIYYTSKKTPSKRLITRTLWKMFYHMPERNRPRTFAELFNFRRDTGPRLMGWEHWDEEVGPISRLHPVRPDPDAPVDPEWVRPNDAPLHFPDSIIEQFMLPVVENVENVEAVKSRNKDKRAERPDSSKSHREKRQAPRRSHDGDDPGALFGPAPGTSNKRLKPSPRSHRSVDSSRAGSSGPSMSESEGNISDPELLSDTTQRLTEAIEKTILDYAYHDLQRDPNAPSRVPESFATASSIHDLETVQIGTFPAHAYLKLDPTKLAFDHKSTTLYPYRGRGPVWKDYSCSVDCVIVLGMLLDIGCTNVDRRSWRYGAITELEKAFIEITNVNWEALDLRTNSKMRDLFLRKLCATVPSIKIGQPAPAWAIWSECTRNFSQFYYRFSEYHQACECNSQEILETDKYANCLCPNIADYDTSDGVWMADLIESCIFNPRETKCIHCDTGTDRSETRIDELPLRLVVSNYVGTRVRINNHTENVNFRYLDSNGTEKIAMYRWLGGIYHKEGHVRIYWTDQERGDNDGDNIRMYDDEVNEGVIFGGIPPQHPSDRVPHDWTDIGFLIGIYERVINPSMEMLNAVIITANGFKRMVALGRSVLQNHNSWEYVRLPVPEDPSAMNVNLPPEDRVIPVATNRFRDVHIHQLPTPVQVTSRATSQTGPSTPGMPPADIDMQDLNNLLDAWPPENLQDEGNAGRPPVYDNLFDSVLNSPSRLAEFPEMWPQGLPGDNGAFNFPSLPRADDADSLPFSMPRTPMMDYVHWPSPDNNIFLDEMEWGTHAGAVKRSGHTRPSASYARAGRPSRRPSGIAASGVRKPNQPSTNSSRGQAPAEERRKAPARRAHQKNTKETPGLEVAVEIPSVCPSNVSTKKAPGKKTRNGKKASDPVQKAAKETTVCDITKGQQGTERKGDRVSKDKARSATSKETGKMDNKKSSAKGRSSKESGKSSRGKPIGDEEEEEDEAIEEEGEEDEEEYKEARSSHGGASEPRPWISGELRMRKTAIRNAMSQSRSKRARFADELEQGPSKRRKL
ncbi:hypothetical protein N7486_000103 [Penicillium sp. IBT 16267x]|nr:hypothetical protein N7486_000103 [Penicillium sp. IBT 16267x]